MSLHIYVLNSDLMPNISRAIFINNWRIYLSLETALSMRSNLASDNFVHDIMYS